MNLNKLMKQAQKMQEQMAKTQAELEAAVEFARKGTLPDPSEVTDDVFA